MYISHWNLHIEPANNQSPERAVELCLNAFENSPATLDVEKYFRGGYMVQVTFQHEIDTWQEACFDVLKMSQQLGAGWYLLGKIDNELNAVLSRQINSHIPIPQLQWAECHINH